MRTKGGRRGTRGPFGPSSVTRLGRPVLRPLARSLCHRRPQVLGETTSTSTEGRTQVVLEGVEEVRWFLVPGRVLLVPTVTWSPVFREKTVFPPMLCLETLNESGPGVRAGRSVEVRKFHFRHVSTSDFTRTILSDLVF